MGLLIFRIIHLAVKPETNSCVQSRVGKPDKYSGFIEKR